MFLITSASSEEDRCNYIELTFLLTSFPVFLGFAKTNYDR